MGSAILPQASIVTSLIQKEFYNLRVKHLVDANAMLLEIKFLKSEIRYIRPVGIQQASLFNISDASQCGDEKKYGQTGIIYMLTICTMLDDEPIFHHL